MLRGKPFCARGAAADFPKSGPAHNRKRGPGAWAAVHAAGLDEVVVGVAVDDFALNAGHKFSVYNR